MTPSTNSPTPSAPQNTPPGDNQPEETFTTQSAKQLVIRAEDLGLHARRDTVKDDSLRREVIALFVDLIEKAADFPHYRKLWHILNDGIGCYVSNSYYLYMNSNSGWATAEGHEEQPKSTFYISWNFTKPDAPRIARHYMDDGGFSGTESELAAIFSALDNSGLWQSLIEEWKQDHEQVDVRLAAEIAAIREMLDRPWEDLS